MLLNYFSIYQSEQGQQERTEGENRLGWSKYCEERDKQINCDRRPKQEQEDITQREYGLQDYLEQAITLKYSATPRNISFNIFFKKTMGGIKTKTVYEK